MNAPDTKLTLKSFEAQILFFNGMYKLPTAPYPSIAAIVSDENAKAAKASKPTMPAKTAITKRLLDFRKTLVDELNEVDDIIAKVNRGIKSDDDPTQYTIEDLLTDIADWLTDIQVFAASEQAKYGLPIKESQDIVMSSNFSKLQADGTVAYDDAGKVQKGPGYWKPEPQLKAMIEERIAENTPVPDEGGIVWRY